MILAPGVPAAPASRLLAALEARGHGIRRGSAIPAGRDDVLVILAAGADTIPRPDASGQGGSLRILVLSTLGAHPDARAAALRDLWRLEEDARATGLPVLTLRLGPLLGPTSPLWLKLRTQGRLPDRGRKLLNPVAESDVIETLERALTDRAAGQAWYEVAGPEIWSLAELAELAKRAPGAARSPGAWEPELGMLAEQRLSEAGVWLDHFGLAPRPLAEQAREWAA